MAVKEMIYLTTRDVLCNNDNEEASNLLKSYENKFETKIIIHKAFYAVSWILKKKDNNVDFGYYWGTCGPFSDYVRLKLLEWIIPGIKGKHELLSAKNARRRRRPSFERLLFRSKR
jgi:hypothetical protein